MSMYSLLESKCELSMLEVENSFGSNICRCTGYRPIMDAFKKYANDSSASVTEIANLHICDKNGSGCCKNSCNDDDWCLVKQEEASGTIALTLVDGTKWYCVNTVSEVFEILTKEGTNSYFLAAGSTSKVPYPLTENPKVVIDINNVSELKGYKVDQNLVIGAGNSLTEMMEIFDTVSSYENFSYLKKLHKHMDYVAHIPVRNVGSIAGNLCIKHTYNQFSSDVYLIFAMAGAQLTIQSMYLGKEVVTMEKFLKTSMEGKVILNVMLPPLSDEYLIETYKVMSRFQAVHAIVNAAFLYKLTSDNIVSETRILYGSITTDFNRAYETEKYLIGKSLFTNETLQGALAVLDGELKPTESPPEPSADLRKKLAMRLFYKSLLSLCPSTTLHPRYLSGATKLRDSRPVSQAMQKYDTDKSLYPLNEPIMKIEAMIQCSGEAQYTDDIPRFHNEVYASLVLSTVAVGEIVSIDPTAALEMEGVIAFYSAKDIPGENTFTPDNVPLYSYNEEVLCSGAVKYYHQPIGIIVAKTQAIADEAAVLVTAKYKNVKAAVVDLEVAKNDSNRSKLYKAAEATEKGTDVAKVVSHSTTLYGQYQFPIETIACVTKPTEEGLEVNVCTQWVNGVQLVVSRALNMEESRIDVNVRRVGGSYGLKLSRSGLAAVACSLVSVKLNRPCRIVQPLSINMKAYGKRCPSLTHYELSVNSTGVIQHADMKVYEDNGYAVNEDFYALCLDAINNCYNEKRMTYKCYNVLTDTPKNTWCRSPGTLELISNTELMMDRIAYELDLDPIEVRLANIDTTNHSTVKEVYETLREQAEYDKRREEVDTFNANNRWKKRGLRFSFMRWTPITAGIMEVSVSIFHGDGSVSIQHGGVEMGQGINTKAAQICAHILGVPLDKIQVKTCNSNVSPNCFPTGGSVASENVCIAVETCCKELLQRMEPVKGTLTDPTWEEWVQASFMANVQLHALGVFSANNFQQYNVYGACLAEVEIDVLTGELEVRRVDLIEDAGRSVSPEIDIGQVEGAFIMALGYWTCEELMYGSSGDLITNRTWTYHVPQARDIPQIFNVSFRTNSYSNDAAFGSKCVGEPPACMAVAVPLAIREALVAARKENGIDSKKWFEIKGPYSVAHIGSMTETTTENLVFY